MKTLTELRKTKATYFVCVDGECPFESESLTECKNWLCDYLKHNKIDEDESYRCFIGMYNIDLE